jgi:flagellar hook-basal body complex protein FliE
MAIDGISSSTSRIGGREFQIEVDQESQLLKSPGLSSTNNEEVSFADSLKTAVNKVNQLQKEADIKTEDILTGKSTNIHETLITVEKADIALKLMTSVRNKIIDAYQEIMKMQV